MGLLPDAAWRISAAIASVPTAVMAVEEAWSLPPTKSKQDQEQASS
ncbi:hypothetical protein [Parasynechococcus sp.]